MKTYALSLCLGTLLLANCAGSTPNSQSNSPAANNSPANKAANTATNETNQSATAVKEKPVAETNFGGSWDSVKLNEKGNKYTQLSLNIKQNGENITGTYSVVDFVGKDPQVEDGNQTPFAGTIKDNVVTIKFDPEATVAGYEENVKYKEPAGGKAPATATLTMSGDSLQWKMASGSSPFELPREVTLKKAKPVK